MWSILAKSRKTNSKTGPPSKLPELAILVKRNKQKNERK